MNYQEIIENLSKNQNQQMFDDLLKECIKVYKDISNIFIKYKVTMEESFKIIQDISNILFAFKTKITIPVPQMITEENKEIYVHILNIYEHRKYPIDFAYTVSQSLADSLWIELTGTYNPLGFNLSK
jgi:hypothetical protein